MENPVGIGVQELRELREMSQEELATRSGLDESVICGIELDYVDPSLDDVDAIAMAMEVPVAYVFMFSDQSEDPLVEGFKRAARKSLCVSR